MTLTEYYIAISKFHAYDYYIKGGNPLYEGYAKVESGYNSVLGRAYLLFLDSQGKFKALLHFTSFANFEKEITNISISCNMPHTHKELPDNRKVSKLIGY